MGKVIELKPAVTDFEGTLYFWRAVETSDERWQPQWGTCGRRETATSWRNVGRPRLDQHDAEDSARKYAEYIAAKK